MGRKSTDLPFQEGQFKLKDSLSAQNDHLKAEIQNKERLLNSINYSLKSFDVDL